MRIALYEPDIPQNTGTILRLAACFKITVEIIKPCGFVINDRRLKRSGMDYVEKVNLNFHDSWDIFFDTVQNTIKARIILLTTKSENSFISFNFKKTDILLLGRESAGVPENVRDSVDENIIIPMSSGSRSLNIAISAAMVLGEAMRQTNTYP
ncbi:MAG: tRNA methyltransferase [Rhodospirillaceae bacterium]|nr:tRNA methyltransferase [Rhodospirillaceae bacterium]OUT77940.1 MAG: tRNA methyltransferase [Rhodospirillaceae bacterium TMED23]|tara:strand:+ start:156 stop:614 length:459 start_codon:yes stop_codon:yes gene_type:complete